MLENGNKNPGRRDIIRIENEVFSLHGLLMNGSITFFAAGTTPGATVSGNFSGDVGVYTPIE